MQRRLFVILAAVVFMSSAAPAEELAFEFTGTAFMRGVTTWRGDIWAGTENGLVRWDKNGGSYATFTTGDGVGHYARSFCTDSEDRLWYATQNGVQCYDGTSFVTYTTENSGLPSNNISAVDIDSDGVMWFGTEEGLCRFDGEIWTAYRIEVESVTLTQNIWKLKAAPDGTVWAIERGKYGSHLLRFDGESWTYYEKIKMGQALNNLRDIDIDADGVVWVASYNGLNRYDGEWTQYTHPDIMTIDAASDGRIWVGTLPGTTGIRYSTDMMNIAYFSGNTWTELDLSGRFDAPIWGVEKLIVEDDGSLLFSVHHETNVAMSLYGLNGDTLTHYTVDAPLSSRFQDIFIAKDNSVWLASSMGLSRYDGNSWDTILFDLSSTFQGFNGSNITEIIEDDNGTIWFIAQDGIRTMAVNEWSFIDTNNTEIFDVLKADTYFTDASFDENGVLWLATGSSIASYDGTNWTRDAYPSDNGFYVNSMTMDANGTIWCVGYPRQLPNNKHYLLKYDGSWTTYTQEELGIEGSIFNAAVDMNGCVWFNCSGGLLKYDGAGFTWYDGLSNRFYASGFNMGADNSGRIWTINTKYLSVYSGSEWDVYDIDILQPPQWTGQFTVDSGNRLWIADYKSVRCYNLFGFPKVAPTGVEDETTVPTAIELTGNYPNPFNPSTTIEFTLPEGGLTELVIYNAMGQTVRELVSRSMSPGRHSVVWDGRDNAGSPVSSGVYISTLRRGNSAVSRRMMLVK